MKRQSAIVFSLVALALLYLVYTVTAVSFGGISFNSMTADITFAPTFTATSDGLAIVDGDNVCAGPINITSSPTGTYDNIAGAVVPCPTFGCGPRPSAAATSTPAPVVLTTQAAHDSAVSTFLNTVFYIAAQPAHIFAPHTFLGQYYRLSGGAQQNVGGAASFDAGLFCYGTNSIFSNESSQGSIPLTTASLIFTPVFGNQLILSSLNVASCSAFVRTTETDGPTKDSVYTSSYSLDSNTSSLNITIFQGINLTLAGTSGITSAPVPGGTFILSVPIQNIGDLDANITGVTLSSNFTVNSFTPNNISINQTIILDINATAPLTPGVYTINITTTAVPLNPPTLVGTCGTAAVITNLATNTNTSGIDPVVIVGPSSIGALSISLTPTPPSIIRSEILAGNIQNETLFGRITRPGDFSIVGSIKINATFNEYHPTDGWRVMRYTRFDGASCLSQVDARQCDQPGLLGCTIRIVNVNTSPSGDEVNFSIIQPLTLISGKESSCTTWDDRIYRVDLSIYDQTRDVLESRSTYFGIYSLSCVDRTSG